MVDDYGISFGNNPRGSGVRINFRDRHLETVNGLNLTLWQPHDDVAGSVNGLALGLAGPAADNLRGLSVCLAATLSTRATYGSHSAAWRWCPVPKPTASRWAGLQP